MANRSPICPYCNEEIMNANEVHLGVNEKVFSSCPKCSKILSVGKI